MSAAARPSLLILVLCTAAQPFALNVLAPATPAIAGALGADYGTIQLTLTLYLATVAVSQLIVGPVSDRIGRRPCIVGGLLIFLLGSAAGMFATGLPTLLAARMLQAAGGGVAFALTRAIARDIGGKDEAASTIGYVTMVMVVVPMFAPLIGGQIEQSFGWRGIFAAMTLVGSVTAIGALLKLPETRPAAAHPGGWLDTFRAVPLLVRERAFVAHTMGLAMTSCVFFTFIAGAPYAVVEHMRASPAVYGLFFVSMSGSYMAGNFITGRMSRQIGAERLARIGNLLSLAGVGAAAVASMLPGWSPPWLFLPLILNGIGNGLTIPTLTAASLSVRPQLAGAAAGLTGFVQLGLGALMSWLSGLLTPAWPPAFLMMMLGATLLACVTPLLNRAGPREATGGQM
jgi:DHA1 family bicyclomycin/chloramphenicol resistance-like MFS transporter